MLHLPGGSTPPELEPLLEAAADPWGAVQRATAGGERILGLQCASLPEELPHALGLRPWRLILRPDPPLRASAVLQGFCCSWLQSLLDQGLSGALAGLVGLTLAGNTCDSIRGLPELWRRAGARPTELHLLRLPARLEGSAARELLEAELAGWVRWLEGIAGRRLEPAALEASARLANRVRAGLRRLQALAGRGAVPYAVVEAAHRGASALGWEASAAPLESATAAFESTAAALEARAPHAAEGGRDDRLRLLVAGGLLDGSGLLEWLDGQGALCVLDETCALGRSLEPEVDLDPQGGLRELAERQLRRSPCAATPGSGPRRAAALVEQARERGAAGVILVALRGCEPHAFDAVLIAEALGRAGLPHLALELDPHQPIAGSAATRLQAFLERLEVE